jgi:hypothetical protein
MGVIHYDESPHPPSIQHIRLRPARALANAGIPCTVWGEDALIYAFFVNTSSSYFHVLVPDDCVDTAATALIDRLPYRRMDKSPLLWTESPIWDCSRPLCFPNSAWLELTSAQPEFEVEAPIIAVHPESAFTFAVRDTSRTAPLASPPSAEDAGIRFPSLVAMVDSIIATIVDPPLGYRNHRLNNVLNVWIARLLTYAPALRRPLDSYGRPLDCHERRVESCREEFCNALKEVHSVCPRLVMPPS